ncbi:hypothetical protein MF271_24155 (plasmid) [Deinococcus sp. KNUC1210]|uniref:hypothetical protein n=1 Tax=Deinococcus sp. KNUC1210 TaxID=2917691 RepID=UPI001EF02B29|nr:hypothetical protein [Deinococcus sp. KNUC1210]ULH18056.1 hypothetical protein MF271_24155 [Deinococcus sp. KNUC1210]
MFFEHAERTRLGLQALGERAFQQTDFDAMRGIGVLVELFLQALASEDDAQLCLIDVALVDWAAVLEHVDRR